MLTAYLDGGTLNFKSNLVSGEEYLYMHIVRSPPLTGRFCRPLLRVLCKLSPPAVRRTPEKRLLVNILAMA